LLAAGIGRSRRYSVDRETPSAWATSTIGVPSVITASGTYDGQPPVPTRSPTPATAISVATARQGLHRSPPSTYRRFGPSQARALFRAHGCAARPTHRRWSPQRRAPCCEEALRLAFN